MRKISLILVAFLMSGLSSLYAQKEMVQFFAAGKAEASNLVNSFVEPFLGTFGNNLNNGWYSTADPLNTGRFTISFGVSGSFVPADKQTFTIQPSNLIGTPNNQPVVAQTMFGANTTPGDIYVKYNGGANKVALAVPKGSGLNISPLPVLQGSVGLIKNTELMLRVFPKLDVKGYKAGYFGVGVKHDIKQWIPFMSKLPFSLSFIGTYTSASLELTDGPFVKSANPNSTAYNDQAIKYGGTAWSTSLIISKKLPVVTFYGGLKLSHYSTELNVTGHFPIASFSTGGLAQEVGIADPISLSTSGNQFGLNAGMRIKLGIFAIAADGVYAPGGYSSATLGFVFGVFN